MIKIEYTIKLYSYWHCGSGLGAGAETDMEVIKDKNGLPYIPGKTLKGLFSDAADLLSNDKIQNSEIFGQVNENKTTTGGISFFSNAEIAEDVEKELVPYLYKNIASTAINDEGIASNGSLRVREVVIPLELKAYIIINDRNKEFVQKCGKLIRHMGSNRNRGLGRCELFFEI
jgi:CRISPR/Cas system CSM-associated protein Csm3 (group 7 of RAMP superfamily)